MKMCHIHTHTPHTHRRTDICMYITEYHSAIKENEVIEISILHEARQISYDITNMQNLKKMIQIFTKKLIYKIETD